MQPTVFKVRQCRAPRGAYLNNFSAGSVYLEFCLTFAPVTFRSKHEHREMIEAAKMRAAAPRHL